MTYIDGFVAPILPGRKEEYRTLSAEMAQIFLDHGALHVVENVGDADVAEGKMTDLWRAVAADKAGGESIAFSWIIWPSKPERDKGWGACMADERMKPAPDMPFDPKRMIFGGFETVVDVSKG